MKYFSLRCMLPRTFELMYVFADERDVVRLRSQIWSVHTYFFPLAITPAEGKAMLRDALERANMLRNHPEFYNFRTNNCTSNLMAHMCAAGISVPRTNWRYVFPSTIISLFHRYGLLQSGETPRSIRRHYYVTERAKKCADAAHFSACIRGEVKTSGASATL